MFSESLPTDVRPGDKVYVVVDGIAYLIVNDDGTELASTNDHLPSNGPISTQCDDSVPPVDWLTSLPNGNFNSMDMSLDNTEVSKQASPQLLGEKISASGDSWETGKTNAELMGSSGVTILQNNDSRCMLYLRRMTMSLSTFHQNFLTSHWKFQTDRQQPVARQSV